MKNLFRIALSLALLVSIVPLVAAVDLVGPCGIVNPFVAEERVDPPQDADKLYLTVYGEPHDPKFQAVRAWFAGELRDLAERFHFRAIESVSPLFRERYRPYIDRTPCVQIQDGERPILTLDGRAGFEIPDNAAGLRVAIERGCANGFCLRRPKQERKPEPTPAPVYIPTPPQAPAPPTIIIVRPQPDAERQSEDGGGFPSGLFATLVGIASIAGAALGVRSGWRKTHGY